MGTIKLLFGIFVIVAVVYVCAVLIPPFFSNYEFEDAIKNEATLTTYSTKPEDAIRDTVASVLLSPHFCYRLDLPSPLPLSPQGRGVGVRGRMDPLPTSAPWKLSCTGVPTRFAPCTVGPFTTGI